LLRRVNLDFARRKLFAVQLLNRIRGAQIAFATVVEKSAQDSESVIENGRRKIRHRIFNVARGNVAQHPAMQHIETRSKLSQRLHVGCAARLRVGKLLERILERNALQSGIVAINVFAYSIEQCFRRGIFTQHRKRADRSVRLRWWQNPRAVPMLGKLRSQSLRESFSLVSALEKPTGAFPFRGNRSGNVQSPAFRGFHGLESGSFHGVQTALYCP
jgi:hypothetical protein